MIFNSNSTMLSCDKYLTALIRDYIGTVKFMYAYVSFDGSVSQRLRNIKILKLISMATIRRWFAL